jgi:hypothetical protein
LLQVLLWHLLLHLWQQPLLWLLLLRLILLWLPLLQHPGKLQGRACVLLLLVLTVCLTQCWHKQLLLLLCHASWQQLWLCLFIFTCQQPQHVVHVLVRHCNAAGELCQVSVIKPAGQHERRNESATRGVFTFNTRAG